MRKRSVALRDATGFPALGSSAVRRPGRSSETAGPPVALPAPARGFRAGSVLSLLYSGGDQSASSFLEAFCLFRRRVAPRCLPSPRFGFARSAPLCSAPRRAALRRAASRRTVPHRSAQLHPLRIFLPRSSLLVLVLPPCFLFLSLSLVRSSSRRPSFFRRRRRHRSGVSCAATGSATTTRLAGAAWTNFTLLTRRHHSPCISHFYPFPLHLFLLLLLGLNGARPRIRVPSPADRREKL